MEWDRNVMELARYGLPPSEVRRDPRPSRIQALLAAGRSIDARVRLENIEDDVSRSGVQGEMKETYLKGKPPPPSNVKTELIGYQKRLQALTVQAYPELYTPAQRDERHAEEQRRKADAFFGLHEGSRVTAVKLRVLRDENGNVTGFAQVSGEAAHAGEVQAG